MLLEAEEGRTSVTSSFQEANQTDQTLIDLMASGLVGRYVVSSHPHTHSTLQHQHTHFYLLTLSFFYFLTFSTHLAKISAQ